MEPFRRARSRRGTVRSKEPIMRRFACFAAFALALVLASAAAAGGPWLGVLDGGVGVTDESANINYVSKMHGSTTTVTALRGNGNLGSVSISGRWGVPRVTLNGHVGGLSTNGRVLVLAEPFNGNANGGLRTESAVTVLRTKPLGGQPVVNQ